MKLTILLCSTLLLSLSILAMAEGALAAPREAHCELYKDGMCSREYDPVCGSDGATYPTECTLCVDNKEKKQRVQVKHAGEC